MILLKNIYIGYKILIRSLCPFTVNSCSYPQPQATINFLSVSLTFLDILYKWNSTIWGVLCVYVSGQANLLKYSYFKPLLN